MLQESERRLGSLVGCYGWFPPLPVAASRSDTGRPVYAALLEETDVFEHELIKGVDLSALNNPTEVYFGYVY